MNRQTKRDREFADALKKGATHLRRVDKVMARLIETHGPLQVRLDPNNFDALVSIVASQQLSGAAAKTIFERVRALAGNGECTLEAIDKLTDAQIRGAGMSFGKIRTVRELAAAMRDGSLNLKKLEKLDDAAVHEAITAVKGMGRWSAEMYLMFVLGRLDLFSLGDGGIRRAMEKFYRAKTETRMLKLSAPWSPYRTVACLYLWKGLG